MVGLTCAEDVRAAYGRIAAALAAHPGRPALEGMLVAEMVTGGLELVLGAKLDPEMGPVLLFGTGGVDLELLKDVTLGASPLDEARALAMIARTRAGALMAGHRGRPKLDPGPVVQALIGLSRLMSDAAGRIAEIDINPFVLSGRGGVALDGLVVLRRSDAVAG